MARSVSRKVPSPRGLALALAWLLVATVLVVQSPTASAAAAGSVAFIDQPQNTGRGLPFVPVIRVLVLGTDGLPVSPAANIQLTVTGAPAGVRLDNGPAQGGNAAPGANYPTATTNALGIASFPGVAIVIDSTAFTGGTYQITANVVGTAISRVSEPFQVGKTSPPWTQFNFNAQRTGWSPNTADMSATTVAIMGKAQFNNPTNGYIGDVSTTPILVDVNLDGNLDLIAVNSLRKGETGTFGEEVRAYNLASGAPVPLWSWDRTWFYTLDGGGSTIVNLASVTIPGAAANPYIIVNAVDIQHGGLDWSGDLILLNRFGALVQQLAFPVPYPNPMPPLIANIGPGGSPAVVVAGSNSLNDVTVAGFSFGPGPSFQPMFSTTYGSGTPMGLVLASAEMRPGNAVPEVVVGQGMDAFYGPPVVGGVQDAGWNKGTVTVCLPAVGSANCSETYTIPNSAPNGVSIADLDRDGKQEIVVNGLRAQQVQTVSGGGASQINVFRGTSVPLASPLTVTGLPDLMNTAALGALDTANLDGPIDIVNVNYGAPPVTDDSVPDAYTDNANVEVRGLSPIPAPTSVASEGSTAVPGFVNGQPTESPGGGILFDIDHDYRPEFLHGNRAPGITNMFAWNVDDSSTGTPPAQMWGFLWAYTNEQTQGIPISPLVAGDVTGDCRAEVFAGTSGGQAGKAEVAILNGATATYPGIPSFIAPTDYANINSWAPASTSNIAPTFTVGPYGTSPGGDYPTPMKQAKLAWNAPTAPYPGSPAGTPVDGGLPIVEYKVWRATDAAFTSGVKYVGAWPSGIPPTPAHPFIDHSSNPNVANGVDLETISETTTFFYKVVAVTCYTLPRDPANYGLPGALRTSGAYESEVRLPQPWPAGSAVTAVAYGDPAYLDTAGAKAKLTWPVMSTQNSDKPKGCKWIWGYDVYRQQLPGGPVPGTLIGTVPSAPYQASGTVTFFDPSVPKGFQYTYRVYAVNCVGESSTPLVVTPVDARTPSALSPTIAGAGTTATITWSPPANVNGCTDAAHPSGWMEGYKVYRSNGAGGSGAEVYHKTVLTTGISAPIPAATPWRYLITAANTPTAPAGGFASPVSFVDSGLTVGETYYYKVSAVNCVGESILSSELSVVAGGVSTPSALNVTLTPASAVGTAATTFTLTPGVSGGTPAYTCTWNVSPLTATLTLPAPGAECTGAATLSSGVAGTPYTVTLSATDGGNPQLSASATSHITVNGPLAVDLQPATASGNPNTVFSLTATVSGGVPPYSCTWSAVAPAGGTFSAPAPGPAACTAAPTFTGGAIGTTYTAQVDVADSDSPTAAAHDTATMDVNANAPPVADFQAPPGATPGQQVSFGDASYDPDGTIVAYSWEFGDGTTSTDANPSHAFANAGRYMVRLTVLDDAGATDQLVREVVVAFPDTTGQSVADADGSGNGGAMNPIADAGPDRTAAEGETVHLGGASAAGLTYTWRQTAGPTVKLSDIHAAAPTFTAPRLATQDPEVLQFALQAASGGLVSPWDVVEVTVASGNHAPVAMAGAEQDAVQGAIVKLDASGSRDADGDTLTYAWSQVDGPGVQLSSATAQQPTFPAPAPGASRLLRFTVRVSDGRATSSDSVSIWLASRPLPDASFSYGADAAAPASVAFHAAAGDGDSVWTFGDGSPAVTGPDPVHTYAAPGKYTVTLERTSPTGEKASGTQDVTVLAAKSRNVADASGAPLALIVGAAAVLLALAALAVLFVVRRRSSKE